jgi:recombination protein RecT
MATQLAPQQERRDNPVAVFRQNLDRMADQLKMALPSHISVEKFQRVATTAVQTNPTLLDSTKVDRTSLFAALTKAAQDGLLPDGREGAIVPFKGKAMWLVMVAGVMVKVRRSGEIADWFVSAVHEKDEFQILLGDDNRIHHVPFFADDPGKVIGAYSIVTFKDGTKSRDWLPRWRIEKARAQGNASNSLQWTIFYDEGAIKTVIKHHAKRLPQSTDIEAAFARDEGVGPASYAAVSHLAEPSDAPQIAAPAAPSSRLDALEARIGIGESASDDASDTASPTTPLADEVLADIAGAGDIEELEMSSRFHAEAIAALATSDPGLHESLTKAFEDRRTALLAGQNDAWRTNPLTAG